MNTKMKKLNLLLIIMLVVMNFSTFAQKEEKVKTIEIITSVQCGDCEDRILEKFSLEKGIKSVDVDLETKIVTVKYRTDKTDPDKIRKAISDVGYDADDLAADPVAYENLPPCCQKGGHD